MNTPAIFALGLAPLFTVVAFAAPGNAIPDRYIVEVRAGVNPRAVAPAHGVAPDFVYQNVVNGFAGNVPPAVSPRSPRTRGCFAWFRIAPCPQSASLSKAAVGQGRWCPKA